MAAIASASCLSVFDIDPASAAGSEKPQLLAVPAYWGDDHPDFGAAVGNDARPRSLSIDGSKFKLPARTIPADRLEIPHHAAVIAQAAPLDDACEPTPDDPRDLTCYPVSIRTGNKFRRDTDFQSQGQFPLELVRTYNRSNDLGGMFGRYWTSTFDRRLAFYYSDGTSCVVFPGGPACSKPASQVKTVQILRPDGGAVNYDFDAARQIFPDPRPGKFAYIEKPTTQWVFHTEDRLVETYSRACRGHPDRCRRIRDRLDIQLPFQ